MHEFRHGELKRGRGGKVKNPQQAIAIALSEAGASNQQLPAENRHKLKRTEAKQRRGETAQAREEISSTRRKQSTEPTRADLYQQAWRADIPGRSRMSKDELQHALAQHRP